MKAQMTIALAIGLLTTAGVAEPVRHGSDGQDGPQSQDMQRHRPGHPPMPGPGWDHNYRPGPWRLLAFKTVSRGTDHDTIRVSNRHLYQQLQLCSMNAPLHITAFDATFDNGRRESLRVGERLGANRCTRALELRGRRPRAIHRIDVTYQQIDRSMRVPLVRVMGR